ncbi:MAG: hypothetical protein ACOYWZ_04060 [Bacillota bacterium]
MMENGLDYCNCPKKKCERHSKCDLCIEFHRNGKRLPYCKREKTIFSTLSNIFIK